MCFTDRNLEIKGRLNDLCFAITIASGNCFRFVTSTTIWDFAVQAELDDPDDPEDEPAGDESAEL